MTSFHISQHDYARAIKVLLRALVHVSDSWTNRGFKLKSERDGVISHKVCVIGAIDLAQREISNRPVADSDLAVALINHVAYEFFKTSAVSVNDDLGYQAVIKLFALTTEKAFEDAAATRTGAVHIEYGGIREAT